MAYYRGSEYDRRSQVALRSQDQGQLDNLLPLLQNAGFKPTLEQQFANPSFVRLEQQSREARVATDLGQWSSQFQVLLSQDAMLIGDQRWELPTPAAARARDYTFVASFPLELISQDAMLVGQQRHELPPIAAARARDYSISAAFPLELIGQDARNLIGQAHLDLPPIAAARARDYSISASFPHVLDGKDKLNAGAQVFDLPNTGPLRARPLLDQQSQLALLLTIPIVAIPYGQRTYDVPRGPLRAVDYTWLQSLPINLLVPVGTQHFALPSIAALRMGDYTIAESILPLLLGQDQMATGDQLTELPPRAASRLRQSGDEPNTIKLVTFAAPAIPDGQRAFDLPLPPAPAKARDYTFAQSLALNLLPFAGESFCELPPSGVVRARDYTFTASFPLELIGQDRMYGAAGEVPAYDWSYQRPKPRYLQGTGEPLQDLISTLLAEQLPMGDQSFDVPRGPARLVDYTWLVGFTAETFPQETIPDGEQFMELAPSAAARARDYTFLYSALAILSGRHLELTIGSPHDVWATREPRSVWRTRAPYGSVS